MAAAPARRRDLGAGPRVRRPRHRRRGAARLHRAGDARQAAADRTPVPGWPSTSSTWFRPLSAGLAVPVFAFFAAGVTVGGLGGLAESLTDPSRSGSSPALRARQDRRASSAPTWLRGPLHPRRPRRRACAGSTSSASPARRYRLHRLPAHRRARLRRRQRRDDHVKVGVLAGSLSPPCSRPSLLQPQPRLPAASRGRGVDTDADGIPDVYETPPRPRRRRLIFRVSGGRASTLTAARARQAWTRV